jgi:hypothetical protein
MIFAGQARAQESASDYQTMRYDVYASGLHALEVNLTNDLSADNRYNVEMSSKTYGLLGKLAPWEGIFRTKGWKGDDFHPEQHQSIATFRGEEEVKTYSYNKDGSFKEYRIKDDNDDGSPKPVEDELTQGTTDILTAALNTMRGISAGEGCAGSTEIFDGKRRFKLIFNEVQETKMESSRWNIYEGEALECTVLVEPVAGKWHEKPRGWASIQEQGRERGSLPTVWFATVEEGKPAIPVKVRVKTDYGTLFMHLTGYESENRDPMQARS